MLQRSTYPGLASAALAAALPLAAKPVAPPQPRGQGHGHAPGSPGERAAAGLADTVEATLTRLEEIIDQETMRCAGVARSISRASTTARCRPCSIFPRLMKQVSSLKGDTALQKRLQGIHSKLALNRSILKMHLEAVREISSTLATAIRDSESDGTYTPKISAVARQ